MAATGIDSANGAPDWANAPSTPAGMSFGTTDSGTKGLQRLDAVAFDNTVHDLTGTVQTPGHDNFPQENRFNNLDNVGSSLVLSAAVQSAWLQAAGELGDEVAKSANDADARSNIYLKVAPCAAADDVEQASCLRQTVQSFGLRAWRRPLSDDEAATVTQIATAGGSDLPSQVGTAVSTLLSSPFFFFRVEVDPNPGSVAVHALNPYEVASRLSYFLWRSCPDDTLLADPRAITLVSSFARQWLGVDSFGMYDPY